MNAFDSQLAARLKAREDAGLMRTLQEPSGLVDFTSNDYLGLARNEALFQRIASRVASLPIKWNGATGSRLLSGNMSIVEATEVSLAEIFRAEKALVFGSGYTANLAVLSSLPQRGDTILYDSLAHACMKDGARLSQARRFSFLHNDMNDLERKLQRADGRVFIAVESIYSMDGDACPLHELVLLAEKFGATIVLDEAHSTGVMGAGGGGMALALGLHDRIAVRIYTFGKAMGLHGACVAGSDVLRQYLVNFARPFIYTTALPPHSVVAIDEAFAYLRANLHLQTALATRIDTFLETADARPNRTRSMSAIQTALFPGNENARKAAAFLQQRGFDVRPILSPTVPEGLERLRLCLHAFNTAEEIAGVAEALARLNPVYPT